MIDDEHPHPFKSHPMDLEGKKTAYHLMTCEEPYCMAIRREMMRLLSVRN